MSSTTKPCPPPSPTGYPIIGDLPHLRGDAMLWEKLSEIRKTQGDVFLLHLGSLKMMVVCGHKLVKKLLEERADGFKYRPQWLVEVKSLNLANGIVWSNGLHNEELRKFVMPAVHPGLGSETLAQKVQNEAGHFVEELAASKDINNSGQLRELVYKALANINCGLILGQRFSYKDPDFIEFMGLMDQMLQRHGVKNLKNFFPILQLLPVSSKTKHLVDVLSQITCFLRKHVTKAEETFDDQNPRGLIDLFIAQKRMTSPEYKVEEEALTHICRDLFVAGTENVACTIVWLVGYVLKYKNIADKCKQNIAEVLGDKANVDADDVKKMTYIQATINEVFRLANITPLSVPHATIDQEVFEGFLIPKETMVLTHMVSVHKDPDYWEDPDSFNPDRFINTDGTLIEKEAFYPFSTGPRYCFGKHLARMEVALFFVTLLRHFEMTPPSPDQKPSLVPTQPGAFVEPETFGIHFSRV